MAAALFRGEKGGFFMQIHVTGGALSRGELEAYCARAQKKYPNNMLESLDIHVDGDYVDLTYHTRPADFSRIRRITGYLVGDMSRWNDAKRAEERDRVKHL